MAGREDFLDGSTDLCAKLLRSSLSSSGLGESKKSGLERDDCQEKKKENEKKKKENEDKTYEILITARETDGVYNLYGVTLKVCNKDTLWLKNSNICEIKNLAMPAVRLFQISVRCVRTPLLKSSIKTIIYIQ